MSVYQLPKHLHPDFSAPGKKPVGPTKTEAGWKSWLFQKGSLHPSLGDAAEKISTPTLVVDTKHGHGYDLDGSFDALDLGFQGSAFETTGFTVIAIAEGGDAGTNEALISNGSDQTNKGWSLKWEQGNNTGKIGVTKHGVVDLTSSFDTPTSGVHVVGLTFDGSNNPIVALDGQTDTISNTSSLSVSGSFKIYLGAYRKSSSEVVNNFNGSVYGAFITSGRISESELGEITRSVYANLLKPAIPMPYLVPGAGGGNITPSGIASLEAFGSATITTGAVSITPNGIGSLEAFGSTTLATSYDISVTGIASEEAFGSMTVAPGAVTINCTGIASAEAFGAASLLEALILQATGIASAEAFGSTTISVGETVITITGIPSAEAFGTVVLPGYEGDIEEYRAMIRDIVRDITRDTLRDVIH